MTKWVVGEPVDELLPLAQSTSADKRRYRTQHGLTPVIHTSYIDIVQSYYFCQSALLNRPIIWPRSLFAFIGVYSFIRKVYFKKFSLHNYLFILKYLVT